jgi:hypothetical protein
MLWRLSESLLRTVANNGDCRRLLSRRAPVIYSNLQYVVRFRILMVGYCEKYLGPQRSMGEIQEPDSVMWCEHTQDSGAYFRAG